MIWIKDLGLAPYTINRPMNQLRRDGQLQFQRRGFIPTGLDDGAPLTARQSGKF